MQHDEVHLTRSFVQEAILDTLVMWVGQECKHGLAGGCVDCQAEVATDAVMVVVEELIEEAVRRVHTTRFDKDPGPGDVTVAGPDNFYNGVLNSKSKLREIQRELKQGVQADGQDPGQQGRASQDP